MDIGLIPDWVASLLRLLTATVAGAAIGLNRELMAKPAGLRTHALVALGSALITVAALQLGAPDGRLHADSASRVIQGVIAGIGFLGGGVILHANNRDVRGLTTAATIWLAAALGVTCGLGHWRIAGIAVAIALLTLVLGRGAESALREHVRENDHETRRGPDRDPES
jgi:putative Mg2+ transporter-C (MgtC) family protein